MWPGAVSERSASSSAAWGMLSPFPSAQVSGWRQKILLHGFFTPLKKKGLEWLFTLEMRILSEVKWYHQWGFRWGSCSCDSLSLVFLVLPSKKESILSAGRAISSARSCCWLHTKLLRSLVIVGVRSLRLGLFLCSRGKGLHYLIFPLGPCLDLCSSVQEAGIRKGGNNCLALMAPYPRAVLQKRDCTRSVCISQIHACLFSKRQTLEEDLWVFEERWHRESNYRGV